MRSTIKEHVQTILSFCIGSASVVLFVEVIMPMNLLHKFNCVKSPRALGMRFLLSEQSWHSAKIN